MLHSDIRAPPNGWLSGSGVMARLTCYYRAISGKTRTVRERQNPFPLAANVR